MDKFVNTNGIKLHYLDHGGDGPTLILMPGLSANAHCFDGLIAAGLGEQFHVLTLDLRGRGLTDKPASGYALADHAADVIGLLDALGLEQVILGGHSYGGFVTMYTAAHYPERVSKLVILDSAGRMHPDVRELIKPSLKRLEQVVPSWAEYVGRMQNQPFLEGYWDEHLEAYYRADVEIREDGTVKPWSNPQAIWSAADLAIDEPWDDHLAAIHQPAVLIRAPENYAPATVIPMQQAQDTIDAIADCTYVEATGNHMTMLFGQHAPGVVQAITDFVLNKSKKD